MFRSDRLTAPLISEELQDLRSNSCLCASRPFINCSGQNRYCSTKIYVVSNKMKMAENDDVALGKEYFGASHLQLINNFTSVGSRQISVS